MSNTELNSLNIGNHHRLVNALNEDTTESALSTEENERRIEGYYKEKFEEEDKNAKIAFSIAAVGTLLLALCIIFTIVFGLGPWGGLIIGLSAMMLIGSTLIGAYKQSKANSIETEKEARIKKERDKQKGVEKIVAHKIKQIEESAEKEPDFLLSARLEREMEVYKNRERDRIAQEEGPLMAGKCVAYIDAQFKAKYSDLQEKFKETKNLRGAIAAVGLFTAGDAVMFQEAEKYFISERLQKKLMESAKFRIDRQGAEQSTGVGTQATYYAKDSAPEEVYGDNELGEIARTKHKFVKLDANKYITSVKTVQNEGQSPLPANYQPIEQPSNLSRNPYMYPEGYMSKPSSIYGGRPMGLDDMRGIRAMG